MVSVCLPSDALLQHLPSYLGFSYVGMGYLFTAAPAKHSRSSLPSTRIAPLGPPVCSHHSWVAPPGLLPLASGSGWLLKVTAPNINKLGYTDDTTLMAESGKEIKSLLMKMKEESEKAGLKLNIPKTKVMASSPITSRQIDRERMEPVTDFIFLGSKITAEADSSH